MSEPKAGGCPVKHTSGGCPVKHESSDGGSTAWLLKQQEQVDPTNMMPSGNQLPAPDQSTHLSRHRVSSSIPKGGYNPAHQSPDDRVWSYPSEQMFYNAIKRKGHQANEEDMKVVVALHNTVNERCWQHILEWESRHMQPGDTEPTLTRFEGRPTDLSPKATMLGFLGYSKPFDRHDWYVERDGKQVRYVIDFYDGNPQPGKVTSMHLDVRPAVDSIQAAIDRVTRFFWR